MILNQIYKNICNQIAELFCEDKQNPVICKASIAQRLIDTLDNDSFPKFISRINIGRIYSIRLAGPIHAGTGCKFGLEKTDLITGQVTTQVISLSQSCPAYSFLKIKLVSVLGYEIFDGTNYFNESNLGEIRLVHKKNDPDYGIVYVPQEPIVGTGGYTSGNGGSGFIQVLPKQTQMQTPGLMPTAEAGFNLQGLLSNPIVWIAGGGLLFFYLMRK